jgi:hypothetical protein
MSQHFDGRQLSQEDGSCRIKDGTEQARAISSDHFGKGAPFFFA